MRRSEIRFVFHCSVIFLVISACGGRPIAEPTDDTGGGVPKKSSDASAAEDLNAANKIADLQSQQQQQMMKAQQDAADAQAKAARDAANQQAAFDFLKAGQEKDAANMQQWQQNGKELGLDKCPFILLDCASKVINGAIQVKTGE